jgi:hypothetical protein
MPSGYAYAKTVDGVTTWYKTAPADMTGVVEVAIVGTPGVFATWSDSVINGVPTCTYTQMPLPEAQEKLYNAMMAYVGPRVDPYAHAAALGGCMAQTFGAGQFPNCLAVEGWLANVMNDYYTRKATLAVDMSTVSLDFSNHNPLPVELSAMYAEVAALMPQS